MSKKIKIGLILFSILTFGKLYHVKADASFELADYFKNVTYKIEKGDKKYQLYFHGIKEKTTQELIYCIEPGVALDSGIYEETSELSKIKLTKEQLDEAALVAYFGYKYKNHDSLDYYLAAQKLIWDIVIPKDWQIYFTNGFGGERIDLAISEQKNIQSLVENYKKTPDFSGNYWQLNINDELKLTDKFNVLSDFLMESNGLNVTKKENELNIKPQTTGVFTVNLYRPTPEKTYQVFFSPIGQDLIKKGLFPTNKIPLTFEVVKNQVELKKYGETLTNPIIQNGVRFQLFAKEDIINFQNQVIMKQNTVVSEKATDQFGIIQWDNLYDGSYCIKELDPNNGYIIDKTDHCFVLKEKNRHVTLELTNLLEKHEITIQKKELETNEVIPNVTFAIYEKNGQFINYITTNEAGIAKITLPIGSYYIEEIEAPNGYIKLTQPIHFDIEHEDITLEVNNRRIPVPDTLEMKQTHIPLISILSFLLLRKKNSYV